MPSPSPLVAQGGIQLDEYPFAAMVDNIAEARPHFGLAGADVVYEAPAEAGIPRLMPIFLRAGGQADRIGPIRITRLCARTSRFCGPPACGRSNSRCRAR